MKNESKPNSLAKKLVQVMKDCGYVQKDGNNQVQHYKYASSAAILEKVNTSLVQHGIATLTSSEILSSTTEKNDKGRIERYVTLRMMITLVDTESDQTYTISGIGSGIDWGDKAIAKAQTMASKYAWMMALNISTGDDPEADERIDEPTTIRNHRSVHIESYERPHSYSSAISASGYVDLYEQARSENEFLTLSSEVKPRWREFTQEEKDMIAVAGSAAKRRLGIPEKKETN